MNIKFKLLIFIVLIVFISNGVFADAALPEIKAQSAILAMSNGEQILYEKNADKKVYPGNLTKLMTALTAYELCNGDDIITITEGLKEYIKPFEQTMNLKAGEQIPAGDLIKAIIIGSYNDAVTALVLHCAETIEGFVDKMNNKAADLGLSGTNFANPTGEHNEMSYTTARDMLLIYRQIYSIPFLKDITDKAYITIAATNKNEERTFWTSNSLSNGFYTLRYLYRYAKGGKASVSTSGGCGVACAAVKGDSHFICIVLGSVQDESINYSFIDAKNILEYGFNNFSLKTILRQGSIVSEIKVKNAKGTGRTLLFSESTVQCYLQKDDDASNVEQSKNTPEVIAAPVGKGDVIGTLNFTYNGYPAGETKLLAEGNIAVNRVKLALSGILWFVSLKYVKFFLITALCLVLAYIAVLARIIAKARRQEKLRKRKKNK